MDESGARRGGIGAGARGPAALARELVRPWNVMSLVRLLLAVLAVAFRHETAVLVALMAIAGLSDALDGAMARRARADASVGEWLDPLCDKAFVLALVLAIAIVHEPPWWLLVLTTVREILVMPPVLVHLLAPGRHARKIQYRALPIGKATTVAQFAVIAALLFGRADLALAASIAAALLGLGAGVEYLVRAPIGPAAQGTEPLG